jgi:hypothetical protein
MARKFYAAIEKLRSLLAGAKEAFVSSFALGNDQLIKDQDKQLASLKAMPAALPSPLQKPDYKFKANQKRAMTGRELTEY